MNDVPLSAQDIRASAEVHGELGPDYQDAVVESFLAKIDKQIEARVDERLAAMGPSARPRRPADPVRLGKFRVAVASAAVGTAVVGIPLTFVAEKALSRAGNGADPLVLIWVVLLAVYGLAAFRLRRR